MSESINACSPREVREYIIQCLNAGLTPYIHGSPGIGKSEIVRSIANEFGLKLIDHRLSTSDPTDLNGFPAIVDGRASFIPFDLFPVEGQEIPEGFEGWLIFLDEFPSAPRSVQAAAYKLILDRMVGQHRLHEKVFIVAAGNLATDRAIVNQLSTAMQSRLIHLEMETNFEQWLEDVAIPRNYDKRIIGYLSHYPHKLMDFRPDHQDKTFACPRTWDFANRLIQGRKLSNNDSKLLGGTISSAIAVEFIQFSKLYENLITIKDIVKDPENCPMPQDQATTWALMSHILEYVDDKNFEAITKYVSRFDTSFRILFQRSTVQRFPKLTSHPAFINAMSDIANYING